VIAVWNPFNHSVFLSFHVLEMVASSIDMLSRVGRWSFTGLSASTPVRASVSEPSTVEARLLNVSG